jgi:hypothetical protein
MTLTSRPTMLTMTTMPSMPSRPRRPSRLAVLAVLAALAAGGCASTDAANASPGGAGAAQGMDEAAMMEAMMKLATPGPQHAELMKHVGQWENIIRTRWAPEMPWEETRATSEMTALLGGRYLMEHMNFVMMGQPMEGISIVGFDNQTGEYTSMWADTMTTWWTQTRGRKAADGSIEYRGTITDVAGTRPMRMAVKQTADAIHTDMYDTIPPAGEMLVMTIDSRKLAAR